MTIADILLKTNNVGFDSFVPLSAVRTEADKQISEMVCVPYTMDEFRAVFGVDDFPFDKVYYTPSISFECCYFNEETLAIAYICPYFLGLGNLDGGSGGSGSQYAVAVAAAEAAVARGDFLSCAINLPGMVAVEYVQKVAAQKADVATDLYKLFSAIYNSSDFGFSSIDRDVMETIFAHKGENSRQETAETLRGYPDVITVYRGGNSESVPCSEAYSWTTDINVANFFASRLGSDDGYIAEGWVRKEDVREVFLDRNESEFLIFPGDVHDIRETTVFGVRICEEYYPRIILTYHKYRNMIDRIPFATKSDIHGPAHEKRVLLMALLLAEMEGLPSSDRDILAKAAMYHDIARTDDSAESTHGAAARTLYELGARQPNGIVGFLCEYHCRSDEDAYAEIRSNRFLSRNRSRVKRLYDVFKDADALDRVRFGVRDVDLNRLRLPVSRQLSLVARINYDEVR